ncbi:MAG TPA: hypothetical protein VKU60_10390, partial [Chloroflexota bacterium]|nr:hypothetical protein [Chloroflexota bacterium]
MRQMFGPSSPDGQPQAAPNGTEEQQLQLAQQRQQTADDYAALEKQMQDSVRSLASTQPDASSKLRDALGAAQQDDLRNNLQRSADWLSRGLGSYSNQSEPNITAGLQKLDDQVKQAQQALANSQPGAGGDQQNLQTALNRVENLRNQMDALSRNPGGDQQGQQGQQGQNGQQGQQGGQGQQGQ